MISGNKKPSSVMTSIPNGNPNSMHRGKSTLSIKTQTTTPEIVQKAVAAILGNTHASFSNKGLTLKEIRDISNALLLKKTVLEKELEEGRDKDTLRDSLNALAAFRSLRQFEQLEKSYMKTFKGDKKIIPTKNIEIKLDTYPKFKPFFMSLEKQLRKGIPLTKKTVSLKCLSKKNELLGDSKLQNRGLLNIPSTRCLHEETQLKFTLFVIEDICQKKKPSATTLSSDNSKAKTVSRITRPESLTGPKKEPRIR
jgi:hypothetical protein